MFHLRPIFLALACCLALIAPAQASAMMKGLGPECRALQEKLVELAEQGRTSPQGDATIALCIGVQAIAPKGIDLPPVAAVETHAPTEHAALTIAKRPPGIDRPPQA